MKTFDRAFVVQHSTTFTPACRMVLVCVYDQEDGEYDTDFVPVVGIRDELVFVFHRECSERWGSRYRFESTTAAEEAGFVLCESDHRTHPIIVDGDFGLITADEDWECDNGRYQLVACPWSRDEDEGQLRIVVDRLKEQLQSRRRAAVDIPAESGTDQDGEE